VDGSISGASAFRGGGRGTSFGFGETTTFLTEPSVSELLVLFVATALVTVTVGVVLLFFVLFVVALLLFVLALLLLLLSL